VGCTESIFLQIEQIRDATEFVYPARTALRERSRALFGGAQYRAEIGAAIADGDGVVCIKDLPQELENLPGTGSVNAGSKSWSAQGCLPVRHASGV